MKKQIFKIILNSIKKVNKTIEVDDKTDLIKDVGMDSIDITELLIDLEHEFDISISNVKQEDICTVEKLINTVNKVLKAC